MGHVTPLAISGIGKAGAAGEEVLTVENLVKIYKGADCKALSGLNITVRRGEIFGLLGPNGAGKTTAIKIMSTLLSATAGRVQIYGTDALKHPGRIRSLLGLVPQNIALYGGLTARENLRYFGTICGLSGQILKDRVGFCLEMVGLEGRADQRVSTYSGGMKRRANLAAGILHDPRILFLDEPTVGIDAQSRNMILEKLSLLKQNGTAIVYTTHYMDEAERLCDRVAIMDEGRIIAEGSPQEMADRPPGHAGLGELFLALTGKDLRD
ncbi:MAG: ABC transporter [Deltaproteobacteria bacterium HGW-Deltaproteobacteria-15]|jgi:ABC-2 type transport system ATP-binding protein|nr:MAG: ABC transporter [Deltaproteobacteria bacterium HGW-Deltaproteobacteria-15]